MTTLVDAPERADGLVLLGTMVGSGYRTPPALVRRADGQTLQLTPLIYAVLEAIDGRRTCVDAARAVSAAIQRQVSPEAVATLVDQHLRPLGLIKAADGTEPPVKRSDPLLSLRFRLRVTDPRTTRRLTDPFRILFRPVVVAGVVTGFLAVTWWVFFRRGLGPAAYDAFQRPHLLLLVFGVTVLSAGFHEFGHAAAARYGGAQPGVMGAGLYLVWPAFYTDVTDSYRLSRRGRIRTDLGGLYFNAVVVLLAFGWWYATRWDALLLLVATQILQMVSQLMPTLRFDGYHVLADLTGVPDLYHRIKPTLLGLLPHRWSDQANRALKPWARLVITAWVLVTVPLMAFMLFATARALPRLLGTAWAAVADDGAGVGRAWRTHDLLDITAHALQVPAVLLPVLGGLLILGRFGLRWTRRLARWSRGSIHRRAAAVVLLCAVVSILVWSWAPRPGTYRPIRSDEKGLLAAVLPAAHDTSDTAQLRRARPAAGAAAQRRLRTGEPLQATFAAGAPLPTKVHPQLALVLVPATASHATATPGPAAQQTAADEPWVFPFDQPLPPDEGDNQALSVNTHDGSTVYDVAFALVWASGDEVRNVNEAHAYASCSDCVTVAVAFQVVLISEDAHVVVPQNLAVAANSDCYRCITAAIASQLVLSVESAPGEQQLAALGDLWNRLLRFGQTITAYSLPEIQAQLEGFQAEIVAILHTGSSPATASSTSTGGPAAPPPPTGATTAPVTGTGQAGSAPETSASGAAPATPAPTSSADGTSSDGGTSVPEPDPQPTSDPGTASSPEAAPTSAEPSATP